MPYTYKSLAFAWLIMFSLFTVSASGVARGWWFGLLLVVAAAVPMLVLKSPANVATASLGGPLVVADEPDRLPLEPGGIDVLRRENEGGARRARLRDRVREPVRAAS